MPRGAKSAAIERVNAISAAFAAPYIATFAENRNAPAEITLTIAACSLFSRYGSAACTRNTGPRRFTSNDFCHASGVNSPSGWVSALAALLTTMSIAPNRSTVRATISSTPASSPMCVGTPNASAPSARRCASVSDARVGLAAADHHVGAPAGQALGHGPPDPAGPAGDDRDAIPHVKQCFELLNVHRGRR